ncbi:MAG: GDSL-type esterase/lipase family protein [Ruthenibacterium sp.]
MAKYKEYQTEARRRRNTARLIMAALLVLIALVTVGLAYVASRMLMGKPLFDPAQSSSVTGGDSISQPEGAGSQVTTSGSTAQGGNVPEISLSPRYWNIAVPVAQTVDNVTIAPDARMLALPANGRVNLEYFRTALFIGDSLIQGFAFESPIEDITNVAAFTGIGPREIIQNNVGKLWTKEAVPMWEYICKFTPMNIYVGIGTNALVAMPEDEAFLKYYGDMLDMLRAQFPNIPIYVQSITPVTQATNDRRPLLANERIRNINTQLAVMAQVKNMYYVNLHEVLADANGCLREDIASSKDGYHMKDNTGYDIWTDYLATHTAYNPYNVQFLTEPYNA